MPSASDELRAKWPGHDGQAVEFLEKAGYVLTREWTWIKPTPEHEPTETEWSAIDYLCDEWDYGGLANFVRDENYE